MYGFLERELETLYRKERIDHASTKTHRTLYMHLPLLFGTFHF